VSEGTTLYCGDNCNHTGPHRYPPVAVDHRFTCVCGHRYNVHYPSGPCAAADSRPGQVTGSGCQCKRWVQP
jgi:hypothetical protein